MNGALHGIGFGLLAMIGWGVGNSITRTPAIAIGVIPTLFYRNALVTLFLALAVLTMPFKAVVNWPMIAATLLLSVIGYISLLSLFKAQRTGKLGLISPISGAGSAVITITYALLFYGENPSLLQRCGMAAVLLGVVFVSINFKDLRNSNLFSRSSGVPLALLTALCWGIMFALMVKPSIALGAVFCAFVLNLGSLVLSGTHLAVMRIRPALPSPRLALIVVVIALFSVLGSVSFNFGIIGAPVSIVYTIAAAAPVIGIVAGIWFYKESHPLHHYFGMLLSLAGIVLIGIEK